jgi:hypothetical protein
MRSGHCFLLALVVLTGAGCSGGSEGASTAPTADVASMAETRASAAPIAGKAEAGSTRRQTLRLVSTAVSAVPVRSQRSIIRNGDLAVRVKAIEPAERQIEQLVASEQGYVDNASSTDLASDHPEIKIAVRVPVQTFESTITAIESMGVRLSKTINSQDVTGQLIDLDARLATMSAEEKSTRVSCDKPEASKPPSNFATNSPTLDPKSKASPAKGNPPASWRSFQALPSR